MAKKKYEGIPPHEEEDELPSAGMAWDDIIKGLRYYSRILAGESITFPGSKTLKKGYFDLGELFIELADEMDQH